MIAANQISSATVQFALTPDGRWKFASADLVSAASAAGFTAVGINADRIDAAAVEAYAGAGARCHEVLALVVGDDDTATMTIAEQLAHRAQTIDAEWVLTVFTATVWIGSSQRFSTAATTASSVSRCSARNCANNPSTR
jgi:hypothetical protein